MERDKSSNDGERRPLGRTDSGARFRARRNVATWLALLLIVFVVAWGGFARFDRKPPVSPPAIQAGTLYPEVDNLLNELRQEVVAKPRDGAAWGRLGMAFVAHELADQAAICFGQAERFAANDVRWPYLSGAVLEPVDKRAALACYRRAIKLDDAAIHPRLNLAEILLDLHRLEEAEAVLFDVLRRADNQPRAEFLLGRLNLLGGDLHQSRRWAQRSAEHQPGQRATHELLLQVYHRLGEAEEIDRQQEILKSIPPGMTTWDDPFIVEVMEWRRDPHSLVRRVGQLLTEGNPSDAIRLARQVVDEHPREARFHEQLIQVLLETGNIDQAAQAARRGAQMHPLDPGITYWSGRAQQEERGFAAAADEFRRAIALKPDHAAAFLGLGECLRDLADRAAALEAFQAAISLQPDLLAGHVEAAKLLIEQGENQQARHLLENAIKLAPEDPEVIRLWERL